ncbi:MAG: hypothetical protein AAGE76_05490 [Pseudomonadota bacterium]
MTGDARGPGFLRPEAVALLVRWREAIIGGCLLFFGLGWALIDPKLGLLIGVLAGLIGLAFLIEGIQRARFAAGGGGAGVVELDERLITYFGPQGGGAVSLDDVTRIQVLTTDAGPHASDMFWLFEATDGAILQIPGDAEGAAAIFDALTVLKDVDYGAAIAASGSVEPARFLIWERPRHRLG